MHEPPYGTPLSQPDGYLAGNVEWTVAIERFSPWLVVFGHVLPNPSTTSARQASRIS
jgi:Icc-related predicted phosphoesterase